MGVRSRRVFKVGWTNERPTSHHMMRISGNGANGKSLSMITGVFVASEGQINFR